MIRKMKCALLLLLAFCMLFTGCDKVSTFKDDDMEEKSEVGSDVEQGLKAGFSYENKGNRPQLHMHKCAYLSDKTEFDIDDVTLEFFWGADLVYDMEYAIYLSDDYPEFDVCFYDEYDQYFIVKHIEEPFVSEKYLAEVTRENGVVTDIKYNYSEMLTIPKEIFSKDKSYIWFSLKGMNYSKINYGEKTIAAILIYYKKSDGKIILSSKPFE